MTIENEAKIPANVADGGRILVGANFKLLPPANVADASRIRVGANFKLLADRTA
jgi:hypothetical protein